MVAVAKSEKKRPKFDGARVRELRLAREPSLSVETLAKVVETSGANLSRIERGLVVPSVELAARIAEALGVTVDDLMGARG